MSGFKKTIWLKIVQFGDWVSKTEIAQIRVETGIFCFLGGELHVPRLSQIWICDFSHDLGAIQIWGSVS